MKKMTIEATVPERKKDGKVIQKQLGPVQLVVDFPETFDEAKKWASAEAFLSNAFANWRVTLQNNMRAGLRKGETPEAIQARLGSSKLGVAAAGSKVDTTQAYLAQFASASPEKQKQMLAELQKRAAEMQNA